MARVQNIEREFMWFTGEDKTLAVTIVDSDDMPVDITDWEIEWRLVTWKGQILVTKTNGAGLEITDAGNGKIAIAIVATDTAALSGASIKEYYHEIKRIDTRETLLWGKVYLHKSVII